MSKKALFLLPISLIVISTASCSWLFGRRDYVSERNPSRILTKRMDSGEHYIRYKNYDLRGDIVDKVIYEVDYTVEYTYLKETPDTKGKSFVLTLQVPSLWAPSYERICFYENGYASTNRYDTRAEKSYTYYYQFDEKLAKKVCELVDDEYKYIKEAEIREQEDRNNVEREYNQMISNMTISTIIDKMNEDENTDLEFVFVTDETPARRYDFTFKDDGSICTALKGATFENLPVGFYRHGSETRLYIKGSGWTIDVFREDRFVKAYYSTQDKYGRNYSASFEKLIDEDSLNTVMNLAYELSAPKNPFGNSSSNPSSSSEQA